MQVGKLNKRIIIQTSAEYVDDIGNQIQSWTDLMTVWASINGISKKEYYTASTLNAENDLFFEVRYCKALSKLKPQTVRIVYDGNYYDVKLIDDYMQSHISLKLRAMCKNGK